MHIPVLPLHEAFQITVQPTAQAPLRTGPHAEVVHWQQSFALGAESVWLSA